jgi:hypothetical protein
LGLKDYVPEHAQVAALDSMPNLSPMPVSMYRAQRPHDKQSNACKPCLCLCACVFVRACVYTCHARVRNKNSRSHVHTHRHTQTHTTQTTKFYNNTHTPHVHREDHWLSLEPVLPPTQAPTLSTAPDLVRLALNHSSPSSVSGRGLESRTSRALSKVEAFYPQIPPSQVSEVSLSLCMCVQMKECVLLDR